MIESMLINKLCYNVYRWELFIFCFNHYFKLLLYYKIISKDRMGSSYFELLENITK